MHTPIPVSLLLSELKKGCPGITQIWGNFLSEAVIMCFDYHKYASKTKILLDGINTGDYEVIWLDEVSEQLRRSWQDHKEMVSFGACGIAVLLVLNFTNYTVLERARIGTGVDYWLSEKDEEDTSLPFQRAARLEVSGILKGEMPIFKSRVKQKIEQTEPTDSTNLPAYIVVVEFSQPMAKMVKK
jgi:hypothetical protein